MRTINFNALEARVFDQIQKDPDFRSQYKKLAEQKVGIFASKLFIFISEDNTIQVRELNFVERIFRKLGFYGDSLFLPEQLTAIKGIFSKALQLPRELQNVPFTHDLRDLEDTEPVTVQGVDPKKIDCLGVRLHKSLKKRVTKQLRKLQTEFKKINQQTPTTLQEMHVKHGQLEAFQEKFRQFATSIQTPIAKAMRNAVAKALREQGVREDALTEHLNDPRQGNQRIYNQTQLFLPTNPYSKLAKQLADALEASQERVLTTILSKYKPQECGGGGDCLFHSLARLAPEKDVSGWRREIAAKIKLDEASYGHLVAFRLQDRDDCVAGISTHEQYADWIACQGRWGSDPEIQTFSDSTERPVLVVQKLAEDFFTLRRGFNLSLNKEPLVLFNIGDSHFQAGVH